MEGILVVRRSVPAALAVAVCICTLLVLPAPAHAVDAAAVAPRTVSTLQCGGRRGGGQADGRGRLYVTCGSEGVAGRASIRIYDTAGRRLTTILTGFYATDVAPSADGGIIYVVRGDSKSVRRFVRNLDGTYRYDTAWAPQPFAQWGTTYEALGEFIATDRTGHLYVSSGTWTNSPNAIIKYDAQGSVVTSFGAWENSWATGIFYWVNTGVAVSPDGVSVYVTEAGNNRVQRFDRQVDGSYSYVAKWGNSPETDDDPRTGICGEDVRKGRLAAPYDIGLDANGTVYVLNTTCVQVVAFSTTGEYQWTLQLPDPYGGYAHGMAVDDAGNIVIPQIDRTARVTGAAPAPVPAPAPQWINPNYTGWSYIRTVPAGGTITAWKWSAQGWIRTVFPDSTRGWSSPWGSGWQWFWRENEWYAVKTASIALDPRP